MKYTGAHRFPRRGLAWFLPLLLASCGVVGSLGKKNQPQEQPFGPTGIPPQLRAGASAGSAGGEAIIPGGNDVPQEPPPNMTPEEDIVFTDPDNPTATIPELTSLLAAPSRGPWELSETVARRRAAREGKPLLIWFTDSARSPICRALSEELFSTPAFEKWAAEKVIRLRIDANTRVSDPMDSIDRMDRQAGLANYVTALKKRYKVMGHPSVIVLNPAGEVIARPRGYKRGQADFFWGLIKHAEAVSATAYKSWRADLEKKGYRDWSDRNTRNTVFAKLVRYSNGELILIEPDGTRARTRTANLSKDDQEWISQQKRLRNIH